MNYKLISLFFLLVSCSVYKNSQNSDLIEEIEIIRLPNNLLTPTGIITLEQFDKFNVKEKDTIYKFNKILDLKLKKKLPNNTSIEIRTKITIKYKNGKEEILLMNRNGIVYIDNYFYKLSKHQAKSIRK